MEGHGEGEGKESLMRVAASDRESGPSFGGDGLGVFWGWDVSERKIKDRRADAERTRRIKMQDSFRRMGQGGVLGCWGRV